MYFKLHRQLAFFNLKIWIPFARNLNSEGSGPSIFLIAATGILFFGQGILGSVIGSVAFAKLALIGITIPMFCIGLLAMQMAFQESYRALSRLRLRAMGSHRFWNELSRVSWNSFVTLGVFTLLSMNVTNYLLTLSGGLIPKVSFALFIVYMLSSTVAVMLRWRTGRSQPSRSQPSRAKECITFFYPMCAVGLCYFSVLVIAKSYVMPVIMVTVITSLTVALVLAISNKRKSFSV